MTPFKVTQQDLLFMLSSAHGCVLVQLLLNKLISKLAPFLGSRSSLLRTLMSVHEERPGLLARVLMEQLTLWTLIVLVLVALTYTSVPLQPFSHQPLPYPSFLIRIILSISVARFVVMTTRIALVPEVVKGRGDSQMSCGQTGHPRLDFLYNAFSAVTNLVCLGYHENLLLGVTSSFMEVSSTPLECCRLIKLAGKHQGSQSYKKTTILSCGLCSVFRLVLPVVFLVLATCQESPAKMTDLPLVWFFLSGVFYFTFNLYLVCQSVKRMAKASHWSSLHSSYHPSSPEPVPVHSHPQLRSNNIVCNKRDGNDDNYQDLKDLNCGLVRPYDNRNLSSKFSQEDGEKVNVLKKKDQPKQNFLSKMVRAGEENFPKSFCLSGKFGKNMGRTSSNDYLLTSPTDSGDQDDAETLAASDTAGAPQRHCELGRQRVTEMKHCRSFSRPSGLALTSALDLSDMKQKSSIIKTKVHKVECYDKNDPTDKQHSYPGDLSKYHYQFEKAPKQRDSSPLYEAEQNELRSPMAPHLHDQKTHQDEMRVDLSTSEKVHSEGHVLRDQTFILPSNTESRQEMKNRVVFSLTNSETELSKI